MTIFKKCPKPLVAMLVMLASFSVHATTFKIATLSPEGSVWMTELRSAAAEIAERTDNRVKFKFYPGGVMGSDPVVLRKMRVGQLHGAVVTSGGMIPVYSDIQLYSLPMALQSADEVRAIRAQFDSRLMAGLEERKFVSFGLAEVGFAYGMSQTPLASVSSVREQKVWVPDDDPSSVRLLEGFGISGIPLSIADVLTGLQTGLIDTVASPPIGAVALQWHTQLSHALDLPLLYIYGLMVVTERQFGKLSAADQAVVREVMGATVQAVDQRAREDHASAKRALANQGIEWLQASAQEAAEWQRLGAQSSAKFVDDGHLSEDLFNDFQSAIDQYRSAN